MRLEFQRVRQKYHVSSFLIALKAIELLKHKVRITPNEHDLKPEKAVLSGMNALCHSPFNVQ